MTTATTQPACLERYLGAARVVRIAGRSLVVELEDATRVFATSALAFPYQPVVGDELLVIGDARSFFVIGVLEAHGRASLSDPKGVSLHAENGRLRLIGDRGVSLRGRRVFVHAERLKTVALTAIRTLGQAHTDVRDALKVEAGEVDELSQGRWLLQAKRVALKALVGARLKSPTLRVG